MKIVKPDDWIELKEIEKFIENEKVISEFTRMYEVKNGCIRLNDFLNLLYRSCAFDVLNAMKDSE